MPVYVIDGDLTAVADVRVVRGSTTENVVLTFQNPDGTPYDLTGSTAHWVFKDSSGNTLVDASTANGKVANGLTDGTWTLVLTSAESWALVSASVGETYSHDCATTFADGKRHITHKGGFDVVTPNTPYP